MNKESNQPAIMQMLTERYKSIQSARSVLSRMFRQMLMDLDVSLFSYDRLMQKYLDDPNNDIPKSGKDRSTARGNLSKQLYSDPMTFKTFLKGIKFLGATHVKFEIHLTRKKKTTVHTVNLDLTNNHNDE